MSVTQAKNQRVFTLIGIGVLLAVLAVFIWATSRPQELRQKAASETGTAVLSLSLASNTLIGGTSVTSTLAVTNPFAVAVDGFQIFMNIDGNIPPDFRYTPAAIAGLRLVANIAESTATGQRIKLVYLTDVPTTPFGLRQLQPLGSVTFTALDTGVLTISFDHGYSKTMQNQTLLDILALPQTTTYTFAPRPTVTPTVTLSPTDTPVPTHTSAPIYTSTPTRRPMETWIPSKAPTRTPTKSPTKTPTKTPSRTPTKTPKPNKAPTITTNHLPKGELNKNYKTHIVGYDDNTNDFLTMKMSNLPAGLSQGVCARYVSDGKSKINCLLRGKPTRKGTRAVFITLKDNHGGQTHKTLILVIQ